MIVFLIDADNLNNAAWIDEACALLELEHGPVDTRRAYGSLENMKSLSGVLTKRAIRSFTNQSLTKNSTDMALAVDAMEMACQVAKPKVIAIGSGDADFVPLVVRLREKNIRVICVTERTKLAAEAVPAYNAVVYVGEDSPKRAQPAKAPAGRAAAAAPSPAAKKVPAKRATAKKAAPAKVVPAEAQKPPAPARKVPAKRAATASTVLTVTLEQILDAVPALRNGQMYPLQKVTESLHTAKLIGKSVSSPKLLRKFGDRFELTPEKQPNHVRYLAG